MKSTTIVMIGATLVAGYFILSLLADDGWPDFATIIIFILYELATLWFAWWWDKRNSAQQK